MRISIALPTISSELLHSTELDTFLLNLNASSNRRLLFYDENISGYIIYTDTANEENIPYNAYLEASILSGEHDTGNSILIASRSVPDVDGNEDEESKTGNESLISSQSLESLNIIFSGVKDDTHYTIWKFTIPITYPRKKCNDPHVVFSCWIDPSVVGSVDTSIKSELKSSLPDYRAPMSVNLFSELNNNVSSTMDSGTNYQLLGDIFKSNEASEKVSTSTIQTESDAKNSSISTSLSIPVSVSLIIRLKSTKPAGKNEVLLTNLNLESSEEITKLTEKTKDEYFFKILNLSILYKAGTIEEYKYTKFPIMLKVCDSISLIYKLTNNEYFDREVLNPENNKNQFFRTINITLVLQVQIFNALSNSYDNISNLITTNWSPCLDLGIISPPINNSLKLSSGNYQMLSQPAAPLSVSAQAPAVPSKVSNARKSALINMYKVKSPNALHSSGLMSSPSGIFSNNINSKSKHGKSLLSTSASSVTVNLTTNGNSTLSGLKLTFQGSLSIKSGAVTEWKVQAINLSPSKLNIRLMTQDRAVQTKQNLYPASNSSSNLVTSNSADSKTDILVYSKYQLYSLYNSLRVVSSGVFILDNDIQIGPLECNSVFETSLRILGVSKGIYNLDGLKIFDIISGDGLDFGKLVEVFVV